MIDVNKVDIRNSFEYMQSVFVETLIYGRIFPNFIDQEKFFFKNLC